MANEYHLQHTAFIIGLNEGSVGGTSGNYYITYDTVELGEPKQGIGLLQWSFGRSFDILREIYVALGNNFGGTTPPSDIQSAISGNNRWTTYRWEQFSDATKWVRKFLVLDTAKQIALQKYLDEIQEYLNQMSGQGVSDLKAQSYGSDIINQYGGGWGKKWGGGRYNSSHNSLDTIHKVTPKTYRTRRERTYNYLKNANFDTPPEIDYELNTTDAEGAQTYPTPTENEPETLVRTVEKRLQKYQKISDGIVTKSGNSYYSKYFKITPTTGYRNNFTTMMVQQIADLFELIETVEYEEIVETANEIDEESADELDEKAQSDHDNIPDYSEAIQKAVAKALSYPDGSVQYSMQGARDMKSSGDCSCFTEICYKAAGLEIGGWTGAQYQTAKKLNAVIVDGNRSVIPQIIAQAQTGDFVLMTKNANNYVAGGASHVGIIVAPNQFRHQSSSGGISGTRGKGPYTDPLDQYLQNYLGTSYQKFSLCRPLK